MKDETKMAIVVVACMMGSAIVFKNVLHIKDTLLVGQILLVPMYLAAGYWAAKGGASNKLWMGVNSAYYSCVYRIICFLEITLQLNSKNKKQPSWDASEFRGCLTIQNLNKKKLR